MNKQKTTYQCRECGAYSAKWQGQCNECLAWNSLEEQRQSVFVAPLSQADGYSGSLEKITPLKDVVLTKEHRFVTGMSELDRVLGGGLVEGSVVLLGGDPGIGKSTLLLQSLCRLHQSKPVLYVSGEESLSQIALRAKRLKLQADHLQLLCETQVEQIITTAQHLKPNILVIDSIQTVFSETLRSAPGTVGQVRECAARLVRFAKTNNIAIFLVGHVTKEGALAGPRVLEHMVDAVLYFEGEGGGRFRVIRAVKNRFGAVNELGIFVMSEQGLLEVSNPSALFLNRSKQALSGCVVMATWQGTRPLLVEVQALVDQSHQGNPRRLSVGPDQNRLPMLLAVLHRHAGIFTHDQDVFVNVVGGVKLAETAADLPVVYAVLSSLRNRPIPLDLIVFGEIGLAGEVRPVANGQERLQEAVKHGFRRAIIPAANAPKKGISGLKIMPVNSLSEILELS